MFFTRSLTSLQLSVVSNCSSVTYTYRAVYITYRQSFTLLAPTLYTERGRIPIVHLCHQISHTHLTQLTQASQDPHKEHLPSPIIASSPPHLISDLPLVVSYIGD